MRGCRLNLYKDHTFEYEWFCDICPLHRNVGTYTRTENTIILNGNALVTWLIKDSQWVMNELEHVYDTAVQLYTDTFSIIRMGGLTLIDYQPLDSHKTKLFNIVLHDTIPEGLKMQVLPFRKMRWDLD